MTYNEYLKGERERILNDILDNHCEKLEETLDGFTLDIDEEKEIKMIIKYDERYINKNPECLYRYRVHYDSPKIGILLGWITKDKEESPKIECAK